MYDMESSSVSRLTNIKTNGLVDTGLKTLRYRSLTNYDIHTLKHYDKSGVSEQGGG